MEDKIIIQNKASVVSLHQALQLVPTWDQVLKVQVFPHV